MLINAALDHETEMHIHALTSLGINRVLADRLMKMTDEELAKGERTLTAADEAGRLSKGDVNDVTGKAMLAATRKEIEIRKI